MQVHETSSVHEFGFRSSDARALLFAESIESILRPEGQSDGDVSPQAFLKIVFTSILSVE